MRKVSDYFGWIGLALFGISLFQSILQWAKNKGSFEAADYVAIAFGIVGFLCFLYLNILTYKRKKE